MKIEKIFNYRCDRCMKELTSENKITIFTQKQKEGPRLKDFDLCKECYVSMVKGIKKGKKEV